MSPTSVEQTSAGSAIANEPHRRARSSARDRARASSPVPVSDRREPVEGRRRGERHEDARGVDGREPSASTSARETTTAARDRAHEHAAERARRGVAGERDGAEDGPEREEQRDDDAAPPARGGSTAGVHFGVVSGAGEGGRDDRGERRSRGPRCGRARALKRSRASSARRARKPLTRAWPRRRGSRASCGAAPSNRARCPPRPGRARSPPRRRSSGRAAWRRRRPGRRRRTARGLRRAVAPGARRSRGPQPPRSTSLDRAFDHHAAGAHHADRRGEALDLGQAGGSRRRSSCPAAFRSSSVWRRSRMPSGSRPLVGSSRISTSGRDASATASASRCFIPSE